MWENQNKQGTSGYAPSSRTMREIITRAALCGVLRTSIRIKKLFFAFRYYRRKQRYIWAIISPRGQNRTVKYAKSTHRPYIGLKQFNGAEIERRYLRKRPTRQKRNRKRGQFAPIWRRERRRSVKKSPFGEGETTCVGCRFSFSSSFFKYRGNSVGA